MNVTLLVSSVDFSGGTWDVIRRRDLRKSVVTLADLDVDGEIHRVLFIQVGNAPGPPIVIDRPMFQQVHKIAGGLNWIVELRFLGLDDEYPTAFVLVGPRGRMRDLCAGLGFPQ